jgi:hypothetical protein
VKRDRSRGVVLKIGCPISYCVRISSATLLLGAVACLAGCRRNDAKNFTGFWEENCDNAFGFQIMPYGQDGKDSVVFCGPGGCGIPGKGEPITFIANDPNYVVVSESEIRIRRSSSWETYHRCTTNTHPILKYKESATDAASPPTPPEETTEVDPHRPLCTTRRCEEIKTFLKSHYCGESPFGNGPDDGCDIRVDKKPVANTRVTVDYSCTWNDAEAKSKCEQNGQISAEDRATLLREMHRVGLPQKGENDVHFTVMKSTSGWSLMTANYDHVDGSDMTLCQVVLVVDQRGKVQVLRKLPLHKTNADVPDVAMWSLIDIADVDGEGNLEVVLRADAYENHWFEVLSFSEKSFKTIFSGLGYYL